MTALNSLVVLSALWICAGFCEECLQPDNLLYHRPGNVSVSGVFSSAMGAECGGDDAKGIEEMAAAVWTVAHLNYIGYIPGLEIGLSMFDSCESDESAKKALIQLVVHQECVKETPSLGVLASPEIIEHASDLSSTVDLKLTSIGHILQPSALIRMLTLLLTSLRWTTVNRIVADDERLLKILSLRTAEEGICVYDEVLIGDYHAVHNNLLYPEKVDEDIVSTQPPVLVAVASGHKLQILQEELSNSSRNTTNERWIFVPLDSAFTFRKGNFTRNSFVILPLIDSKEELKSFIKIKDKVEDHLNHREATKSPLFLQVANAVLELLRPLKDLQDLHCPNMHADATEPCAPVKQLVDDMKVNKVTLPRPKSVRMTSATIADTLKNLRIPANENDEMFLFITTAAVAEADTYEDVAVFHFYDLKESQIKPLLLIVNDEPPQGDATNKQKIRRKREQTFKVGADVIDQVRKKQGINSQRESLRPEALIIELNEPLKEDLSTEQKNTIREFDLKAQMPNQEGNVSSVEGGSDSVEIVRGEEPRHPCSEVLTKAESNLTGACGICQNLVRNLPPQEAVREKHSTVDIARALLSWRFDTWVAINVSVAAMGVICVISVFCFIVVRMCKGDILEGSPYFSFLMLLSVILVYAAILPFSVEFLDEGSKAERLATGLPFHKVFLPTLVCDLRILGPVLSYSILFSILLSRSLMLASSDQDGGFMSHINGYLQSVLCFFMCGVQLSLSSQYWLFNSALLTIQRNMTCSEMHANRKFVILLGYSFFLLLILICICPFMYRCKRNYKEGALFSGAIFAIASVWVVWVSLYFVLPLHLLDAVVAFGLTATATTILVCIFIPRTYLMMSAMIRDRIANTLPPLGCTPASNVSEVNYRSNQALYDSVDIAARTPKQGLANPNFYTISSTDNTEVMVKDCVPQITVTGSSNRKHFPARMDTPENTYEAYDSPPSPRKVTKF